MQVNKVSKHVAGYASSLPPRQMLQEQKPSKHAKARALRATAKRRKKK